VLRLTRPKEGKKKENYGEEGIHFKRGKEPGADYFSEEGEKEK